MSQLIYTSTARNLFGLTPNMIHRLGDPDKLAANPHGYSASPARLYRLDRVEEFVAQHRGEIEKVATRRAARWQCQWYIEGLLGWAQSAPVSPSNYCDLLRQLKKKPGSSLAYLVLRDRLASAAEVAHNRAQTGGCHGQSSPCS